MKQRIITSLVLLAILIVVMLLLDTLFFNFVIAAIGIMAVLELLGAVKCTRYRGLCVLSVFIAACIPFAQEGSFRRLMPQIMFVLIVVFFLVLLYNHRNLRVEQASMMFFFSIFVPVFFSSAVYIRNSFGSAIGGFYLIWAMGSGWLSDTGAYFTGMAFGKRKLAPGISPKKTVEGLIGGLVAAVLGMLLIAFLYERATAAWASPVSINYWLVALLTPVFTLIGVLGDLSSSVIKRQAGIKDFGNIFPGHGGVLDRFDSVLFTLPAVFILVDHLTVASLI